ncbi:HEAT repeat domain-containing protein [Actinoplanes sp. L3-i22]|uniref:HEAT repeat domain-containing protein n=1 Tax=Actinoplanes sp. L3-i22 TaxID=2836373 RepID=UPI001C759292|nr:HEAT repeat domain-containing protein [Actinoplanes sp. L3-i22]BCY10410.1 hypothetical protein L3i22_054980 [Actinoplanes sp. L3-i22]
MPDTPAPEELPLDLLLRLARREIEDPYGETSQPALVALHQRPTREVFDIAATLLHDNDVTQRELGAQILRNLGDEGPDGRPFRVETITLMRARLRTETDPAVLSWIISALGYHHGKEALPQVLAFTDHPDDRVRFHIAAALTSLVDLDRVEPEAADALIRLCHDEDDETRFYALYAATREIAGLDVQRVTDLAAQLTNDPDEQIQAMAVAHLETVREVRALLTDAGADDHLIGPVLVTLGWAGTSDDAARLLDEEIRRHAGPTPTLAERLVTWWADREDRTWG